MVRTPWVYSVAAQTTTMNQATTSVKNLILAMNGEKPIAQVNPEVKVVKTG